MKIIPNIHNLFHYYCVCLATSLTFSLYFYSLFNRHTFYMSIFFNENVVFIQRGGFLYEQKKNMYLGEDLK